jgi:hypothetical protein
MRRRLKASDIERGVVIVYKSDLSVVYTIRRKFDMWECVDLVGNHLLCINADIVKSENLFMCRHAHLDNLVEMLDKYEYNIRCFRNLYAFTKWYTDKKRRKSTTHWRG